VILASVVAWAVIAARRLGSMTLPAAWEALTRNRVVRVLVVVGWMWHGWHLFARGSGAFK
jgi:hypothetical protein